MHCKQQVEFALTTSSRSRAVAAVEAAHARSRPASPQTRGWHRERARPTTSRSREIYNVFGHGECSYVSEAVFAFRQETELCARSHDNSLPAAFLICPGSVIVCFQGPLPLRGLIAALTHCLARAARGAAGDLIVRQTQIHDQKGWPNSNQHKPTQATQVTQTRIVGCEFMCERCGPPA